MATSRIKLTRQRTTRSQLDRGGQKIRITASNGVGIAEKLFRYRMLPLDPSGSSLIGQFDGICSPEDFNFIPEDEAGAGDDPAWFRLDYVDLIVRAPQTADDLWGAILSDITILKNALDNREDMSESSSYAIDSDFLSIAADETGFSSSSSLFSESLGALVTTREITLVFNAIVKTSDGFNIRVVASDASGISNKIFRYMRHPLNPNDASKQDKFDGVCSPSDIEDFPENAPFGYIDPKFFRLNYADLVLETLAEAEDFREVVVEEVESLKLTYDMLDTFDDVDVFWVGDI